MASRGIRDGAPLGANDQAAELAGGAEFGLDAEDAAKGLGAGLSRGRE